jgi:ABC-type antimicrobial peptide transport system permease subunit
MIRNYLKMTLRHIGRYKGYSLINILGLAIGIAGCLLILLWVLDELGYDRFHQKAPHLYRVEENQHYTGRLFHVNVTPYPIAPALVKEIPEIKDATRFVYSGGQLFTYEKKAFFENSIWAVDPSFLQMFTFPLARGNRDTALTEPQSMIISGEIARKYFGDSDPLGKSIIVNNEKSFKITGVLEKVPHNSSLQFDILIPYEYLEKSGRTGTSWGSNSIQTFVELHPQATAAQVNEKIFGFIRTRLKESQTDLVLMPFTRLHLHGYFGYTKTAGPIQYVYIFSIIALFVLLIACINFMNLSTARSANRAREVGMRKVAGASRGNLIRQFYGEAIIFAFIAMGLALLAVRLILPAFNTFAEKEITFAVTGFGPFLLGLSGIILLTGLVAGSYPALYLSSFQPVKILKGELTGGTGGSRFRRILVVFQFTLSVFLIISTIIVSRQLHYMKNKNLGYDKEHLIYIVLRGGIKDYYAALKNELAKGPEVLGVTGVRQLPSMIGSNSAGADWDGKDPEFRLLISQNAVDYDFVKTMKMELGEGRDFSEEFAGDKRTNFLVNEEVAGLLKKDSAVGQRFSFIGIKGTIVGVIKNFHFQSLRTEIEPLALYLDPGAARYLLIRIAPGNIPAALSTISKTWKRVIANYPFEYKFLDEDFDRMYRAEEQIGTVVKYFTYLTIFVACLGLFGLASFSAEKRTKEIGIRKVLGASVPQITLLLCREFFVLVLLANFLAWPLTYLVMDKWLQNYANRISPGISIFVLSMILTLMIATASVVFQAVRAALANPVEALKYE